MRQVDQIPHHTFRITIHSWNERWIGRIEWGPYEQIFKTPQGAMDLDTFKKRFNDEFLKSCMLRFKDMHDNFENIKAQ